MVIWDWFVYRTLDAGIRQAEACRGDPVGLEALPGHGQASKPKPKKGGS